MKPLHRIKIALLTIFITCSAGAAVITITEPSPETGDKEIELLRKAVWSLDAAADIVE
jgi:hypothetical protein